MAKVVVLGGCGGIGSVAARTLVALGGFDQLVVADVRAEEAARFAASLGAPNVTSAGFDARSPESLASVLAGADVVCNCVGPFYEFGPPILEAAIRARVNYVDVCDDLAPTRTMLALDGRAREAGISALLGMGNSPGLANVFVALCRDMLLDQVLSADIMHIHGGEPEEGPAVIKHRIHAMVHDVPMFVDGKFVSVRQLEPSGQAFVTPTDFRGVGTYPVFPYPHPETITLPEHVPGIQRATNLGVIFPLSYFELTQAMVRAGAAAETPIQVKGQPVIPLEFTVSHILSQRARLLAEAGVKGPGGCLKVVVSGLKDGKKETYDFQLASRTAGAGEGTGIPAGVGTALMLRGGISQKGVFPPEAGVAPMEYMMLAMDAAKRMGQGGGDTISIDRIDADGNRSPLPFSF